MNYILDTCVVSELVKKKPDQNVVKWVSCIEENRLFLSVLTIGEIHKGIGKLPDGKRKSDLQNWVNNELKERFKNRIIDLDLKIAITWGTIQALSELAGKPLPAIDGQIVATGIALNYTIVTRNVSDMAISGASIINPWEE